MTLNENTDQDQVREQLLVEYQVVQTIADHEVQTVDLTFALFLPLLVTASASLLALLVGGRLQHGKIFLAIGIAGSIITVSMWLTWGRVANRRQQVRKRMFTYQGEIAHRLGGHMTKQKIFEEEFESQKLIPGPGWLEYLLLPVVDRRPADATFVNLMRLSIWPALSLWATVLIMAVLEVWD